MSSNAGNPAGFPKNEVAQVAVTGDRIVVAVDQHVEISVAVKVGRVDSQWTGHFQTLLAFRVESIGTIPKNANAMKLPRRDRDVELVVFVQVGD